MDEQWLNDGLIPAKQHFNHCSTIVQRLFSGVHPHIVFLQGAVSATFSSDFYFPGRFTGAGNYRAAVNEGPFFTGYRGGDDCYGAVASVSGYVAIHF